MPILPSSPEIIGNFPYKYLEIDLVGHLDILNRLWTNLDEGPVLVRGVSGVGKTRIAVEIARDKKWEVVIWHRASDRSRAEEILVSLHQHFRLTDSPNRRNVLAKLRESKILVVIDNAEWISESHLDDYQSLIFDLFSNTAKVLLTTTTDKHWEDLYALRNIEVPTITIDDAQNLVLIMQRVFSVKRNLQDYARQIAISARQHPGLMQWAVRKCDILEPQTVINDLANIYSALEQNLNNTPENLLELMINGTKAQMNAFEMALTKTESTDEQIRDELNKSGFNPQSVHILANKMFKGINLEASLKKLTIFRNGFTKRAAMHILGSEDANNNDDADIRLGLLIEWQFVNERPISEGSERFDIDVQVIRKAAGSAEYQEAQSEHYNYFLDQVRDRGTVNNSIENLHLELANLDVAFEWALSEKEVAKARDFYKGYGKQLREMGYIRQTEEWLMKLAERYMKEEEIVEEEKLKAADLHVSELGATGQASDDIPKRKDADEISFGG